MGKLQESPRGRGPPGTSAPTMPHHRAHLVGRDVPGAPRARERISPVSAKPSLLYFARASFQRNAGLFAIAREGCLSGLQRGS